MRSLLPALLFITLAFALLGSPGWAEPTKTPTPKKLTLAQALAAMPPADGLWLTVSAEQVTLPDGAEPPTADANLSGIAAAFGDQTAAFGAVTAIAPQTMVLLNNQPDAPNIAADMNAMVALKMLSASLNDSQWQALTSQHGLGLTDLTDDTQRGLFHALFNHGHLWIASADPALQSVPEEQRTDVRDVTSLIDMTRVRLGQTAHIYLYDKQGKTLYFSGERPDAAQRLHTYRPKTPPLGAEHGVSLRAEVPNIAKPSDLDWDSHALQASMPTADLKTVGELITQVDKQTGLELYADPHYSSRTLTMRGAPTATSIADLLQAVCLCVAGTFRKVGPAYVLTDDLIGVGVRRKHLEDWEDAARKTNSALENQAGQTLLNNRASTSRKLPTFGDPLAITPEEMAALPDSPAMPGIPRERDNKFPVSKLSPAQQAWVRQTAADFNEKLHSSTLPSYLDGDDLGEADLTHNVDLQVNLYMQLLVPSANMPVDTNLDLPMWMLFYPGYTEQAAQGYAAAEAKALAKLPPPPTLSAALHLGRRRAVLAHPRTAADADALIAAMQKLGLNTLLLDIFSDGVNHIKTSAVNGPDILTEALTRTRGTGIEVYADLSLLSWGDAPPESVQDLTIDGQTSREAAVQAHQDSEDENFSDDGKPIPFVAPGVRVSPSSPKVQATLTALVQDLAARPGLAGFVWQDADTDYDLGYTLDMRLAFLRAVHADPVDVTSQSYVQANDTLPLFDEKAVDSTLPERWRQARIHADAKLFSQMRAALWQSGGRNLPILMEQEQYSYLHWLASWDNPKQMPPPLRDLSPNAPYPSPDKVMRLARTQGQIILRSETIQNDGETLNLARKLRDDLKAMPSDGFVLDFSQERVTQGAAPLDALVRAVSAERSKTVQKTVK